MAVAVVLIILLHYLEGGYRDRVSMRNSFLIIIFLFVLAITGMGLKLGNSIPFLIGSDASTPIVTASKIVSKVRNDQSSGSVVGLFDEKCSLSPCFGYYDHDRTLSQEAVPSDIAHHFIPWGVNYVEQIRSALAADKAKGVNTLMTLEPWPWAVMETGDPVTYKQREASANRSLVADIAAGYYDPSILISLDSIAESAGERIIVVRLMHEMEIMDQYPWSPSNSQQYIQAYRHVVDLSRQRGIHNIRWMWSPAGFKKAASFWPGESYVDYVGLSLYATPEWNGNLAPKGVNVSLDTLLKARYWVRQYKKPIVLAEVGINGPTSEKRQWFRQALSALSYYPEVVAWVYFNQQQPPIVPLEIGLPNWSLTNQEARDLKAALLTKEV
jgi:endoglucanase